MTKNLRTSDLGGAKPAGPARVSDTRRILPTSGHTPRANHRPVRLLAMLALVAFVLATVGVPVVAGASGDLRSGGVFSMSNSPAGNNVVAYRRGSDGMLVRVGMFATGGTGSGGFEDSANGLVLGSSQSESSPNNLTNADSLLFATNAGSNTVTVFQVQRNGLRRVEVQASGGEKPVSVTVNRGVVYVLNSGEFVDGLKPPNCASGNFPTITGFRVSAAGQLTPIPNSTRKLSGRRNSGCAQVSFSPDGRLLVVTERAARMAGMAAGDEGLIHTFAVGRDGRLGRHRVINATGEGPFGFTFTKGGDLLTSEQFDGPMGPGEGAAAGYRVNANGTLTPSGPSVKNGGTDTCWIIATDNGRYAFATSFFKPGPRISSYRVGADGALTLLQAEAAAVAEGAADISLSRNSEYLYQLNAFEGTISVFRISSTGRLAKIQTVNAHPPSAMAARLGLASN